jgi:hypothetical protein
MKKYFFPSILIILLSLLSMNLTQDPAAPAAAPTATDSPTNATNATDANSTLTNGTEVQQSSTAPASDSEGGSPETNNLTRSVFRQMFKKEIDDVRNLTDSEYNETVRNIQTIS